MGNSILKTGDIVRRKEFWLAGQDHMEVLAVYSSSIDCRYCDKDGKSVWGIFSVEEIELCGGRQSLTLWEINEDT